MKAVILAGGGGTRLWPLSTPKKPKQFQRLISDKTLIEETLNRLDFLKNEDIYIAINKEHKELVEMLCRQIPKENIIIEPALRDTASCIGFSASIIEKRHPGETMAVIYADHLITNKEEFQKTLQIADKIAQRDETLNIIEVEAKEPNPNLGYVKIGKKTDNIQETEVFELDHFTEKPDIETAKKFIETGQYLWNTGIYVWKASTLLNHYKTLQKESWEKFQEMTKNPEKVEEIYPTLKKISIDYAIMEKVKASDVRLIKAVNLGWSDIGTWETIWGKLEKNSDNNVIKGDVKTINSKNSIIYGEKDKKIAVIGLDDIIVIETTHGLLICKKGESGKIKELL